MNILQTAKKLVVELIIIGPAEGAPNTKEAVDVAKYSLNAAWKDGFWTGVFWMGFVSATTGLWVAIYIHGWV